MNEKIFKGIIVIIIVLCFFLILLFLSYLIGNVYKGMLKRKKKMDRSFEELLKVLNRDFELIPSLLQELNMPKELEKEFYNLYKEFNEVKDYLSPAISYNYYKKYQDLLSKLLNLHLKGHALDFAVEQNRLTSFSIPLYNLNVKDYNHFKNLFFNRRFSKLFHFKDGEYFTNSNDRIDTTIDFQLER